MKYFLFSILFFLSVVTLAQNENISQGNVFDGEPYIAMNPNNSHHMVVAWMSFAFPNRVVIKTRVTTDAGLTWSAAVSLPHVIPGYTSADVSMEFGPNGNVYLSFIDFSGYGVAPFAGAVYVVKSIDGGVSWGAPTEVISINSDPGKHPIDRPWISIDRSGGPNNGNIYITSMNAKEVVSGPFNPYFMVSKDGANSFSTPKYLDTTGWLAGNTIPQPMPTHDVASDGTFHAVYPSYVASQNFLPQFILASSTDAGDSFDYHTVFTTLNTVNDSLAKKGYLLRIDPSDPDHLLLTYLDNGNGDVDVYTTESFDKGLTWSNGERVNDDPIGNGRMQDMVWADFDSDGDFIVLWRDRRNGSDSTYRTSSETWGALKNKGSNSYMPNFRISSMLVPYDSILDFAGNDFMGIEFEEDTINVVWGDPRTGKLNIWYQRMSKEGYLVSVQQLASEDAPEALVYPNPAVNSLTIEGKNVLTAVLYNSKGQAVSTHWNSGFRNPWKIDVSALPRGAYFVNLYTAYGEVVKKIVKE